MPHKLETCLTSDKIINKTIIKIFLVIAKLIKTKKMKIFKAFAQSEYIR